MMQLALMLFCSCIAINHCKIIPDSSLNLSEVLWQSEPSGIYLGSPSIHRNNSDGLLLATNDFFGSNHNYQYNVSIHISSNNGLDWTFLSYAVHQYWSNIFSIEFDNNDANSINNGLYLLGTDSSAHTANIKLSKSTDGGKTWNGYRILNFNASGLLNTGFNTGPTPSLIVNNTLFRGIESFEPPYAWGVNYGAMLVYCALDEDLTDMANWKHTIPVYLNVSWFANSTLYPKGISSAGYLEGNAVLGRDGVIREVLRFDGTNNSNGNKILNHAVIMKLNPARNVLQYDSFVYLPGGHTKFVIHFDAVSGKYISLTNNATCNGSASDSCRDPRNILTLVSSDDLYTWTVDTLLLADDTGFDADSSRQFTGFHYVDWHFDGKDGQNIIYLIRTSYRGANSYHNSNRITFKTVYDFRQYL